MRLYIKRSWKWKFRKASNNASQQSQVAIRKSGKLPNEVRTQFGWAESFPTKSGRNPYERNFTRRFQETIRNRRTTKTTKFRGRSLDFKVQITFCVEAHLYFKRFGAKFEEKFWVNFLVFKTKIPNKKQVLKTKTCFLMGCKFKMAMILINFKNEWIWKKSTSVPYNRLHINKFFQSMQR